MGEPHKLLGPLAATLILVGVAAGCSTAADLPATDGADGGGAGGGNAASLANGASCSAPNACASGACVGGLCAEPTCTDGARDGDEKGVDCGGRCLTCDGDPCARGADCASGACLSVCMPKGTKTCGVGLPTTCAPSEACQLDADCTSDYCDAALCAAPPAGAHADGRRDAGETDVDCGGTSGVGCGAGLACKVDADCVSTCGAGGICDAPSDHDGKLNQGETAIDCGGPVAKKCAIGKACLAASDCGLGYCPAPALACAAPTSSDGVKNGTETDIDCGGAAQTYDGVTVPAAPGCAVTKSCGADLDCASGVCATNQICIEAPSCRSIHGGQTCGQGEFGQPGAAHESCCKSLPVPGLTMVQGGVSKQVYLDKYEITAGRIRAWVADIKAQYGGIPNIQAWVTARIAADPILAAMFPSNYATYLPQARSGQFKTFPLAGGGTTDLDMGLDDSIGPTSYYRGVQIGGTSGCWVGLNGYGHRTYWYDDALSKNYSEVPRPLMQDILDEKSMNCMPPIMFAAFCAWDGGYLQTPAAIAGAYGPSQWPWGDTPAPASAAPAFYGNYNTNTAFSLAHAPAYLWPNVNYDTFANDLSPVIAAPGRFPLDRATQSRPAPAETWMDLGGNMIEWSQNAGAYYGWTGASFEGHVYPRMWTSAVYFLDKYGKGDGRCMRLK